jgi:hypothetical protein
VKPSTVGVFICAAAALMAVTANAAIVTFTGLDPVANSTDPRPNSNLAAAAFDAAAGALGPESTITFEGLPLGAFTNLLVTPGVNVGGPFVSIRDTPLCLPDRLCGYNTTAAGDQFLSMFGQTATFTFATPISAFGFYYSGVQEPETIQFSDGTPQLLTMPFPSTDGGVEFFGVTDAGKQISSFTVNALTDIVGIDDVRFVGSRSIPEPATLALLGLSVAALGFSRRHKVA